MQADRQPYLTGHVLIMNMLLRRTSLTCCMGSMLWLQPLPARSQPPLQVQWMSELPREQAVLGAIMDPNTGRTEIVYDATTNIYRPCPNEEYWLEYDLHGRPGHFFEPWGGCLNAGATHDQYATGTARTGLSTFHAINACDLNVINCWISCNGTVISGPVTGSPSYSHASATTVLADGAAVYLAGSSSYCPETGWTLFKLGGGPSWPVCIPAAARSLEATSDSILSISFPTVRMVDKVSGAIGSSFELFNGSAPTSGKSCMSGDTLFWACRVNGSLRVGKYLLGQGSLWEQALPFSGSVVELVRDAYNRIWMSAGNNLVWFDAATGSFSSAQMGEVILGMDLQGDALVIAGTMSSNVNFIMHGTPTP